MEITKYNSFFMLFLASYFMACSPPSTIPIDSSLTAVDSAYAICKDVYFWNENLSNLSPKELKKISNTQELLEAIKVYSGTYNGKLLDRWSISIKKETWRNFEQNQEIGFGINLAFNSDNDLRVRLVYSQSQAYQKGLRRGSKILRINNIDAKIENKALIMNAVMKEEVSIQFVNQLHEIETVILKSSLVQKETIINSVILKDKIGYFYFDVFSGGGKALELINRLFEFYKKENIKELIVDLRYNSGGDGLMAHQIANLIVPKAAESKIFARIINNEKYSLLNYSLIFKPSLNNLNLDRIFFITSPETASASEVLINGLQAVMEVKVIGTHTHGKPFGFIPYEVGDDFIFPVAFKALNDKGYGDYYDGIPVDFAVEDDFTRDFGDTEESCLKSVLAYVNNGKFPASQLENKRLNIEMQSINEQERPLLFYVSKPR